MARLQADAEVAKTFAFYGMIGRSPAMQELFDAVRRFAALALATSGTRSEAIQTPKYLASASSLSRTAILLATAKMGTDERKYLRQGQRLNDPLEKLCATS